MTQKIYIVEGRQFRTEADYNRAMHDKELIDKLRKRAEGYNPEQLKQLKKELQAGKHRFLTILGEDFQDEIEEKLEEGAKTQGTKKGKKVKSKSGVKKNSKAVQKKVSAKKQAKKSDDTEIDYFVAEELARQEKRRKRTVFLCSLVAVMCLGYFAAYSYYDYKTASSYDELSELKEKPVSEAVNQAVENNVKVTLDGEKEVPEVLDEYKNLINKNKKLIGWVKIADTNIDYPVMQTSDNEYYLDHNLNQEYDKNGSIFMDKDCDVLKPSTNFILYGHHMKSGKMFGNLHLYSEESYYEKHPYIEFDTIYEKGTYQVMYAFRSRVYSEEEIVFKYYQFIDAYSEQEFDSYMQEMAAMSYYDTGVTATYGDQLLTLSTCDYQEKDGRFVVVAKKIK